MDSERNSFDIAILDDSAPDINVASESTFWKPLFDLVGSYLP